MKKKNRNRRKVRKPVRREKRTVQADERDGVQNSNAQHAATPWLRMVSNEGEDDPRAEAGRGFRAPRNGRRQPRDLDLYTPEGNSQKR
jgi:hypothetical protein